MTAFAGDVALAVNCTATCGRRGSSVCKSRHAASAPQAVALTVTLTVADWPGLITAVGQFATAKRSRLSLVASGQRPIVQPVTLSGAPPGLLIVTVFVSGVFRVTSPNASVVGTSAIECGSGESVVSIISSEVLADWSAGLLAGRSVTVAV